MPFEILKPIVTLGQVLAVQQIFGKLFVSQCACLHTLRPRGFNSSLLFDAVKIRFTVKKLFNKSECRLVVFGVGDVDFQQPF